MIAYRQQGLEHLWMLRKSQQALHCGRLRDEEVDALEKKYAPGYYSPNIFIGIGLFILTQIALSSVVSFLGLMLMLGQNPKAYGYLLLFQAMVSFLAIEFFIRKKNHYKSGVDQGLMWSGSGFLIGGLNILFTVSLSTNLLLIMLIAVVCSLRYLNVLTSALGVLALLAWIYLKYVSLGEWAKHSVPFVLMGVSVVLAALAGNYRRHYRFRYYEHCLLAVQITALIAVYGCTNFYVVKEWAPATLQLPQPSTVAAVALWSITLLLPLAGVTVGILKKQVIYLRLGLLLSIAEFFTLRYYYHRMPIEWVMTLLGIGIMLTAYLVTRYLKKPRSGMVSFRLSSKNLMGMEQAEALIIADTLGGTGQLLTTSPLGGGSSGGAGATGNY